MQTISIAQKRDEIGKKKKRLCTGLKQHPMDKREQAQLVGECKERVWRREATDGGCGQKQAAGSVYYLHTFSQML